MATGALLSYLAWTEISERWRNNFGRSRSGSSSGRTTSRLNFRKQGYFWLVNLFVAGMHRIPFISCPFPSSVFRVGLFPTFPNISQQSPSTFSFFINLIYSKAVILYWILTFRLHPSFRMDTYLLPLRPKLGRPLPHLHNPRNPNQHRRPQQRNLVLHHRRAHLPRPSRRQRLG